MSGAAARARGQYEIPVVRPFQAVHDLGSLTRLLQAQAATVPAHAGSLKWFSQSGHAAPRRDHDSNDRAADPREARPAWMRSCAARTAGREASPRQKCPWAGPRPGSRGSRPPGRALLGLWSAGCGAASRKADGAVRPARCRARWRPAQLPRHRHHRCRRGARCGHRVRRPGAGGWVRRTRGGGGANCNRVHSTGRCAGETLEGRHGHAGPG